MSDLRNRWVRADRSIGASSAPRCRTAATALTKMSELEESPAELNKHFQTVKTLAQVVLVGGYATMFGCVIPPPLGLEVQDAVVNSPPAILSIRDQSAVDLVEPGPILLSTGAGTFSVTILDTDPTDDSFVRVFVDYNRPDQTPARASCRVNATGQARRTVSCDVGGVCLQSDIGQERLLWVEVFDREPLDAGTPRFRAMPAGGLSTRWQFLLRCQEGT